MRLRRVPSTLSTFLVSLVTLVIISFVGLLGFNFIFDLKVKSLEKDISETQVPLTEVERINEVKNRLASLDFLISNHRHPTKFFKFIQKNAEPKIRFITVNVSENALILSGEAENYSALAKQLVVFENREISQGVKSVELISQGLGAQGRINFNFRLELEKIFFIE